jgi:CubicO group peptidase (beta-lactamase class C family)
MSASPHDRAFSKDDDMIRALSLVAALLAGAPANTQDMASEVDKIFSWAQAGAPGCACAVSQNGKVVVSRAYGSADLERGAPLSTASIFDAGSLQKQFVAAAALLLVEDGRIALTDDVRKYIPELPDYGHKITIDNLLTHTSGVRDWVGLMTFSAGKEDALTLILRQRALNFTPGDEFSYTNSGVVLVKEVVARASGMSFGEFTRTRLFEPLGMQSTSYRDNMRDVIKNRAIAYQKEDGAWKMSMLLDNDRGGGGILSTPEDLVKWSEALANHRIGKHVSEKLQEPTTLNSGRKVNYGRGLFLGAYRGTKEVWHTGSADAYKSWLASYPEKGLSIAIMCNSGDDTPERRVSAHRIFDLFVPDAPDQSVEGDSPPPAIPDGVDITSKTGIFFSEQGNDWLRLAVDRGRFRIAGGPGLARVSDDHFRRWGDSMQFMSGDGFELNFVSADQFELKSTDGKTTKYRRAQPYTPTPDALKAFAGRFANDELGTVFVFEPKGDVLTVHLAHAPERTLEFTPVATDTFNFSLMMVRFVRDKNGKVVGFDYSNPIISSTKFTRLGDT